MNADLLTQSEQASPTADELSRDESTDDEAQGRDPTAPIPFDEHPFKVVHGRLSGVDIVVGCQGGWVTQLISAGSPMLVVASLSAFLGGFVGAFAKDLGSAAGKAGSEALQATAKRLRDRLREHAGESRRIIVNGQDDGRFLVVENLVSLPDLALEELVRMELPDGPVTLRWDRANWRWRQSKSKPTRHVGYE